ncbi:MAG: chemotaxis protein CheD [Nitrospirae bacterium]|nr:chemotaxis protein CheD [Nitrospirota bacterium]
MQNADDRFKVVELRPGEIHVADGPTLIRTLLGSCVSVCLFSPQAKVGAMSHSVLPYPRYRPPVHDVRYVECALEEMLDEMLLLGIPSSGLEAKLFGGAEMFHKTDEQVRFARLIGDGNTVAARTFLEREGVRVVSECIGGNNGMKLVFNTSTGVVFVRKLTRTIMDELLLPGMERVA